MTAAPVSVPADAAPGSVTDDAASRSAGTDPASAERRAANRRAASRRAADGPPPSVTAQPVTAEVVEAAALIRAADRIVIACHVNPDGDALGSALALGLALAAEQHGAREHGAREHGAREVCVSFGTSDGAGLPESLAFLPGQHLLRVPAALTEAPDLLVTMDTGSADRLGPLQPLVDTATRTLVVDHHASNTEFGTHLLLDTTAASTTVIVSRLIDALGLTIARDVATCLYVGLVTDTGQFQFSATTAAVHTLAARLLAAGVEPEPIGRRLFGTAPFAAVKLQGVALQRAVLEPGLVWTWLGVEEREAAGVPLAQVEAIIDALRVSVEADVAVVLKGIEPDVWMASTRSRGTVDVSKACVSLGGGGHRFAAGVTLTGTVDDVMAQLRGALSKA